MHSYELETHYKPFSGTHTASLVHQGTVVATHDDVPSIKEARKWARGAAEEHADSTRPLPRESYSESFTL